MEPTEIVNAILPILQQHIDTEISLHLDQLRQEFQATVEVLDGNDSALVAEIQRLRASGGEQVAETLTRAGESWERFIRAEAEHLGLRVMVPKVSTSVQISQTRDGEVVK